MVESTVILSARIGAAELTTLVAGAWLFAGLSPIATIATAVTAGIQIKKRKRFLTRATRLRESQTIFQSREGAAAAVAIGIRKAARQAARDLPPDERERFVERAMKRCSREKWLIKSEQDKADAVATSPTALSANVRTGSDVLSELLAEDSRETRIGLSAAARKAAETFAKMPGSKVIKHAQAHRHMTASSSELHSWDDKGKPIPFTLNVLNMGNLEVSVDRSAAEGGPAGSG
jgi:hypothetical protein